MLSFLFDTPVAAVIREFGGKGLLPYPEEHADYNITESSEVWERVPHELCPSNGKVDCNTTEKDFTGNPALQSYPDGLDVEEAACHAQVIVVSWYSDTDSENPQKWTFWKKFRVFFTILYVSLAIYMSGSIYAAAQHDIAHEFDTSSTVSSLGLAPYVLGYGIGPMVFSPPSELPSVGRNIP